MSKLGLGETPLERTEATCLQKTWPLNHCTWDAQGAHGRYFPCQTHPERESSEATQRTSRFTLQDCRRQNSLKKV